MYEIAAILLSNEHLVKYSIIFNNPESTVKNELTKYDVSLTKLQCALPRFVQNKVPGWKM